ncbi:MAG: 2-hydroxyacid dehydrogenase [Lachnospirales bacterium]
MKKILIKTTKMNGHLVVNIPVESVENFRKKFPNYDVVYDVVTEENIKDADILMCRGISEELIGKAEKLQAVFVPLTGLDSIPVKALEKRGIPIFNTHAKANVIAERAFSLLLTSMGRIIPMDENLRKNKWANRSYTDLWYTLFNKKVAFYGFGHIGQYVAKLMSSFDVEVCTLSRHKGRCDVEADKYFDTLEELADYCEVLVVSTPLNDETRGSINLDILNRLNGHVVNVGRGPIIDEESLYNTLKNGTTLSCGLDVWYNYPKSNEDICPSNFPFNELDNIVMSPHSAWATTTNENILIDDIFTQMSNYCKK